MRRWVSKKKLTIRHIAGNIMTSIETENTSNISLSVTLPITLSASESLFARTECIHWSNRGNKTEAIVSVKIFFFFFFFFKWINTTPQDITKSSLLTDYWNNDASRESLTGTVPTLPKMQLFNRKSTTGVRSIKIF